jgi:hypothetical protein
MHHEAGIFWRPTAGDHKGSSPILLTTIIPTDADALFLA